MIRTAAVVLVVLALRPAFAANPGTGARGPAFDPTGSHPLPNEGVDGRRAGAPADSASCGCRSASAAPGASLLVAVGSTLAACGLRRRRRILLASARAWR